MSEKNIHFRIVEEATKTFGLRGHDGASTREIARAADTCMSSITYHFGGKAGLYLAVADHIAMQICQLVIQTETPQEVSSLAPAQALEELIFVIDRFTRMLIAPGAEGYGGFMLREQERPSPAFHRLYDGAIKSLIVRLADLITAARPGLTGSEAKIFGFLLFGQTLMLSAGCKRLYRLWDLDTDDDCMHEQLFQKISALTRNVIER